MRKHIIIGLATCLYAGSQTYADTGMSVVETFLEVCLETGINYNSIMDTRAIKTMQKIPDQSFRNYFAGIQPNNRAIFASDDSTVFIGIGYGGDITPEVRRMFKAGLSVETLPIDNKQRLPDVLGTLPDATIGRKKCNLVTYTAHPEEILQQVRAIEHDNRLLAAPDSRYTKNLPMRYKTGVMQVYLWKHGVPGHLNLSISVKPVSGDLHLVGISYSDLVFETDHEDTYKTR